MIDQSFADLARKYVAQSNAHDLVEIQKMFLDNASYESAYTGAFEGRDSIADMMKGFFERIPDVEWRVESYADVEENVVEFAFVMCGTDRDSGQRIERRGVERIRFTDSGRICHIDVR